MWGAEPRAASANSITFVSQISVDKGIKEKYGLSKRVEGVRRCRDIGKKDMKWNDSMPKMKGPSGVVSTVCDGELTPGS
jgi:urease